jgi:hypothetical protein
MIDVEPEFVLAFLRRQLPVFHRITEDLLDPVMSRARSVREGLLTVPELNELLLRVVLSVFLVPGEDGAVTVGVLEGALDSFLRLAEGGEASGQPRAGRRTPKRQPA